MINQIKEVKAGMPSNVGRYDLKAGMGLAFLSIIVLSIKILLNKKPSSAVVQLINNMGKRIPASTCVLLQAKTLYGSGNKQTTNKIMQEVMLKTSETYHNFMCRMLN